MRVIFLRQDNVMNRIVANLDGVRAAVAAEAEEIGARAEARLALHRQDGNARIEVKKTRGAGFSKTDWFVSLVDSDNAKSRGNAKAIEFGHFHNFSGKYIPGLYIITGAAGLI